MVPPPFDIEQHVRRHGAALRQLAAALLGDGNAADDAVQATWLDALRHPPRHDAALGGWFATLLHNVVRGFRRRERRRLLREQAVAALRGEQAEDHAVVVAREETVQRLLAALASLDAPYRDVVWQRYFEGKAPREIAAASGVPLATVKSRLQRGLGNLRERLGEGADGERGDWRRAFAVAFGIREGAAVASTAAVMTGGVLVATWTKGMVVVVAVVVAAMWWWPRDADVTPAVTVGQQATDVLAPAANLGASATGPAANAGLLVERREAGMMPSPVDPKLATIRGRCVDGNGAPLANAKVWLHGWEASQERVAAWLVEHARPEWRDPPEFLTGSDGLFTFTFWPPGPYQFSCQASHPDMVPVVARWLELAEGEVVDAGDVVMLSGANVRGHVVDDQQQPLADVGFQFASVDETGEQRGRFAARTSVSSASAADGTFAAHAMLPAGSYEVRIHPRWELHDPFSFAIEPGQRVVELTLVVDEVPAARRIHGKVIDDAGTPVAAAQVRWTSPNSRPGASATTGADGAFVIYGEADAVGQRGQLLASAIGYETASLGEVAWGGEGVELRVDRTGSVQIRIVDPEGRGVARYSVRMFAHGGERSSSEEMGLTISTPSADGEMAITGMKRGGYCLVVEFPAASGFAPRFERIDYRGGPRRLELRAERSIQRPLCVVRADGAPVGATRVQLCELLGDELTADTLVYPHDLWFRGIAQRKAFLLQDLVTDNSGRCLLSGPPQVRLGLRVLGPGHVPLVDSHVALDSPGELVVTVTAGGVLRGRVVPAEAVVELARLERVAAEAGFAGRGARIELVDGARLHPARSVTQDEPMEIASRVRADGSFELAGVPPGEWRLDVGTFHVVPFSGRARSGQTKKETGPRVVVREGEATDVEVDLTAIVPGSLRGRVVWNGAPLANAAIVLDSCELARRAGAENGGEWINLRTDGDGCFEHFGAAGTFELVMWSGPGGVELPQKLRASNQVTMVRGQTVAQTFVVATGMLRLRLLDAAGRPIEGVEVWHGASGQQLPPSGLDGNLTAELAQGAVGLRTLPKSLLSTAAQQRLLQEALAANRRDAFAGHWLDLGTVIVAAGQTTTHEVRLPPEWDK